jgi:hypothetical protein
MNRFIVLIVFFVKVCGGLALVPTALALYFLRPYKTFWTVLSVLALEVAITGPVFACTLVSSGALQLHERWDITVVLGLLRVAAAPLFAVAFFTCLIFAPTKLARWLLIAATILECAVTACIFFTQLFMITC